MMKLRFERALLRHIAKGENHCAVLSKHCRCRNANRHQIACGAQLHIVRLDVVALEDKLHHGGNRLTFVVWQVLGHIGTQERISSKAREPFGSAIYVNEHSVIVDNENAFGRGFEIRTKRFDVSRPALGLKPSPSELASLIAKPVKEA